MQRADYEQALAAARRWIEEYGRYPQQQEWEYQAPRRPTTRTIKRRWGWEQLMREAAGDDCLRPKRGAGPWGSYVTAPPESLRYQSLSIAFGPSSRRGASVDPGTEDGGGAELDSHKLSPGTG
jgi:hypothetical protein